MHIILFFNFYIYSYTKEGRQFCREEQTLGQTERFVLSRVSISKHYKQLPQTERQNWAHHFVGESLGELVPPYGCWEACSPCLSKEQRLKQTELAQKPSPSADQYLPEERCQRRSHEDREDAETRLWRWECPV
jgi:hypothetical protein